jgi:hypothetical protein
VAWQKGEVQDLDTGGESPLMGNVYNLYRV